MAEAAEPQVTELRRRATSGMKWVGASQIVMQVIRTIGAIIVARLLAPEEYGLAMLALVFSSLVLVFSDLALGSALVQRNTITEDDRSTAFWITVASGLAFTVIGVATSGLVARLYGEPDVQPLLTVLSLSFILTALGATQQSLLLREMSFARLETLLVVAALAGAATAVALAAAGTGAWAIIGQQLAMAAVGSALMWRASPWRPHLRFSKASARDLGGFSGPLVGHRLLFYMHQNADRLIIGRALGPAALGAYAIAYNVMLQPAARIASPVTRVLAPVFARMQDEPARIAAAWAKATRLVGAIAIPALTGVIVVAPDFVPVVLGEQWRAAIPVIQLLAVVGMVQAVQAVNVDILMARDRTSTLLRYSLGFCGAHIVAFLVGVHWGIVGVAAAYAVSSALVEPTLTILTARALGVSPMVFVRSLSGVVQAAGGMGLIVLAARVMMVDADVPPAARLVALSVLGAVVFVGLALWRAPEVARDVRGLLQGRRPARPVPTPPPPAPTPTPVEP
jgi:O-antigen/teichoic acid export membrane protein